MHLLAVIPNDPYSVKHLSLLGDRQLQRNPYCYQYIPVDPYHSVLLDSEAMNDTKA